MNLTLVSNKWLQKINEWTIKVHSLTEGPSEQREIAFYDLKWVKICIAIMVNLNQLLVEMAAVIECRVITETLCSLCCFYGEIRFITYNWTTLIALLHRSQTSNFYLKAIFSGKHEHFPLSMSSLVVTPHLLLLSVLLRTALIRLR